MLVSSFYFIFFCCEPWKLHVLNTCTSLVVTFCFAKYIFYLFINFFSRNVDNDFADLIRVPETGLISDVSWKFLILQCTGTFILCKA